MFKIESKVKNGGIWDGKNKRLLKFVNGVAETDDAAIAEKCKKVKGFTVTEIKAVKAVSGAANQ